MLWVIQAILTMSCISSVRWPVEHGMDVFRVFDSLNYLPNLQVRAGVKTDTRVYKGTVGR